MIDAIIVDDEPHCIQHLQRLLQRHTQGKIRLLGSFEDVAHGVDAIKALNPQLLFLDIQLGERTGFDLLRQLDTRRISVIFTTAYDQYAVQAFKFSAIDYLLKPIDGDDLVESVQRAADTLTKKEAATRYELLLQHLDHPAGVPAKIALPSMEGWDFTPIAEIIRCQAQGNYTLFVLQGGKQLLVSRTLKGYEQLLESQGFFRVHHAHLVNLAHVNKYHKSGFLTLNDGSTIEVSTRRREAFLTRITARSR
ncbi:LytR/AlgR family response regulator transcription factor [Parapedobacter indicus]|uniref:Two component transcriptional regulator, LytTR family n=1 Tax=Parapedobacter indicus TaxID=1477437 RepID=A0A1I3LFC4_9SPHI|nr:response regulator transcription factor [Parapedobacter indicus]PPL01514.1 LytTR family two component transcriptional regulator [Parapedobacter indicus]SFI83504.1 two component transcriptional regulator, LytTR family [Parapedobacter indicus]